MTTVATLLLVLAAPAVTSWPPLPEGPPPGLSNARLSVRPLAGSLADEVRAAGVGPAWIGYAVPSLKHGHMCCYDSVRGSQRRPCGMCRLEGRQGGTWSDGSDRPAPVRLENDSPLAVVMLRVDHGRVGRLGVYSDDCGLDAGDLPVLWLKAVPAAQSLAVLEPLAASVPSDEALAAIAAHADPAADAALERLVAPGRSSKLREQAAFWMGESRGRRGYETLRRLVREDKDSEFREHAVFALSESEVPEAQDAIIEVARTDTDPDVRGQALFWLAQKAGRGATAAITRSIEEDPETEVKKKAVFALSELPGGEGVPLLIGVARANRNPAVREQAFFWLGQSEDPRALDFIADVLKRP
ncbi:MAG TPA: HEAT repeat domain-containing protein [Vicinamibacteria bacterium]|nr:HEAT repeat domain-containing protein [Vicinamibacteria bacterium]